MTPAPAPGAAARLAGRLIGGLGGSRVLLTVGVLGGGVVCGFLAQFVLARVLTPAMFGIYSYVLGWLNVSLLVAKLELDSAAIRFVSQYRAQGDPARCAGFLRFSRRTALLLAATLAVTAAAALLLAGARVDAPLRAAALVACLILPVMAVLGVETGILQGFERSVAAQFPNNVLRPALIAALAASLALLLGLRLEAVHAVAINLLAAAVALAVTAAHRQRAVHALLPPAVAVTEHAEWLRVCRGLVLASGAQLLLSQYSDIIVVGTMLGTEEAGRYGIASQLSTVVNLAVTGLFLVASPQFAALHGVGDLAGLQRFTRKAARASAGLALPLVAALILGGRWLLGLFGPSFVAAYPVLVLLASANAVIALLGAISGYLMSMTGHQDTSARVIMTSALLYLGTTLVLTPRFGAVGTAAATLLATTVRAVALAWFVRRRIGIGIWWGGATA